MATATAKIGALITINDSSVELFEGDIVTGLRYLLSGKEVTVDGAVRVINATTKANSTIPATCPPEPYVHQYITINSLMIDSSDMFDAEMIKVDVNSILGIGSVNGTELKVSLDGKFYDSLADAVSAAKPGSVIRLVADSDLGEDGMITIPDGADLTISGDGSTKLLGRITLDCSGVNGVNLKLKDLTLDGTNMKTVSSAFGLYDYSADANPPVVNVSMENVTIQNYSGKGMYLTNIKNLNLTNVNFIDNATGDMNTPNTYGDYTLDLNLIACQDAVVTMSGVKFSGKCGSKAVVSVKVRGGASDADAADIPKDIPEASISKMTMSKCVFADADTEQDVRIGTTSKTSGQVANTTGDFPVDIITAGSATTVVLPAVVEGDNDIVVPMGSSARKDKTGMFELA